MCQSDLPTSKKFKKDIFVGSIAEVGAQIGSKIRANKQLGVDNAPYRGVYLEFAWKSGKFGLRW